MMWKLLLSLIYYYILKLLLGELDEMTFKNSFQLQSFYDSNIYLCLKYNGVRKVSLFVLQSTVGYTCLLRFLSCVFTPTVFLKWGQQKAELEGDVEKKVSPYAVGWRKKQLCIQKMSPESSV